MSTMWSPHISLSAATIMGTSLPVSPQIRLGPSATWRFSFWSKQTTPLPLSKERPPTTRGKISMSVPVSWRSSSVPSGSSSSLIRRTAAMKRRLSGSATVLAGSFRAMVTSPNFLWSPEPMPRNFVFPGSRQSARSRRCNSSTNSRWSCGSSSACSTRCVAWLKYSRPFEPVYVNSPRGATQSSISPSALGRPPSGAAVMKTALSVQWRAKWLSHAALYADWMLEA
mmetsp:Transcript_21336/g.60435  ORF Transcript_21336/g.60435 Transcript_21336/m.60435 type:complete len:226 (+) Transcript_21336:508-1185(+)